MKNTFRTTFDGSTNPIASYDANKVNIGTLIRQYTDSGGKKYLQPLKYEPYSVYAYSFTAYHYYLEAISWSDDIDYVFSVYAAGYGQFMYIYMHKYTRSTGKYWGEGSIAIAPNWAVGVYGNVSRQSRAWLYRHTDGTVSVSGSAVTGSGTTFQSSRIAAGARIGFGTTDHTQVKSWYEIASISNDGLLTLLGTPGTIPAGTSYVIEELRIAVINERNGNFDWQGLILIKGLNEFTFGAKQQTYIPQATTVDNIRAFYKLDPGTSFFPASIGGAYYVTLALDEPISNTQHDCYVMCKGTASATTTTDLNFGQQLQIIKYNLRAPLTFVAPPTGYTASSTSAFEFSTGMQYVNWYYGSFLGIDVQYGTAGLLGGNSMLIATPNHGPTKGQKTLFILTQNRIYACLFSEIYRGSQTFLEYEHIYYPPGGKNEYFHITGNGTYLNPNNLSLSYYNYYQFSYSPAGDYLLSQGYYQRNMSLEKFGEPGAKKTAFPWLYRYVNQFSDPRAGEYFSNNNDYAWQAFCRGILHMCISNSNTTGYHQYYAIPVDCDSEHAILTKQLVILPKYGTPDCLAFQSAKVYTKNPCDDDTMRMPAGEVRLYYRTSGIDANTGTWSRVPDNGDLSRISAADQIQFAFSWEILSITGVVPYVYSLDFCYEDGTTEEHYFPSKEKTSVSSRMFVFRQCQKWNSAIPSLRIRIYNDDTGLLVLDDTVSASNYGDWVYSTDGYSWSAWNSSADAVGNWIRYTADNLPADTTIRVLLTT